MKWSQSDLELIEKFSEDINLLGSDDEILKFVRRKIKNPLIWVKFIFGLHLAIYGYKNFKVTVNNESQNGDSAEWYFQLSIADGTVNNDDGYTIINGIGCSTDEVLEYDKDKLIPLFIDGLKHWSVTNSIEDEIKMAISKADWELVQTVVKFYG